MSEALLYNDELLKLNPNDQEALEFRDAEYTIKTPTKKAEVGIVIGHNIIKQLSSESRRKKIDRTMIKSTIEYNWDQVKRYQQLCRKEIEPTAKQLAPLKCRYLTRDSPYLLIGPLKIEEAHLDPDIFIFHNVIYDKEIDVMKMVFKERVSFLQKAIFCLRFCDACVHFAAENC